MRSGWKQIIFNQHCSTQAKFEHSHVWAALTGGDIKVEKWGLKYKVPVCIQLTEQTMCVRLWRHAATHFSFSLCLEYLVKIFAVLRLLMMRRQGRGGWWHWWGNVTYTPLFIKIHHKPSSFEHITPIKTLTDDDDDDEYRDDAPTLVVGLG